MIVPNTFGKPWLTRLCKAVQQNPNYKMLGMEILGSNLPKMLVVRNLNESLDIGVNDVGNTIGFFGGLHLINKWCEHAIKKYNIRLNQNAKLISQGRVLKSVAIIPPLFAVMWSTAFLKNAVTVWRSGSTDFRSVITSKGDRTNTPEAIAKRKAVVEKNLRKFFTILASCIGLAVLGSYLTLTKGPLRLFEHGKLRAGLNWTTPLVKFFSFHGKDGKTYSDLQAVLFWILPGNLGFIMASRDRFEFKEQLLKMSNFAIFFWGIKAAIKKAAKRQTEAFAKIFPQVYKREEKELEFIYQDAIKLAKTVKPSIAKKLNNVIRFENMKIATDLGFTAITLNAVPALINIYLTYKRMARADAEKARWEALAKTEQAMLAAHNLPFKFSPPLENS